MTHELLEDRPIPFYAVVAARVSRISAVLAGLCLTSLHILKPDVDPTWHFISAYMLGRYGWIMALSFYALAACLVLMSAAILSQIRTIPGYVGLIILFVSATGLTIAGIFPTDPISVDPDALTDDGKMHVLGASLDYTPVAALLIGLSLARTKGWRPIQWKLLTTAWITILLTVLFIVAILVAPDGRIGPGNYAGLIGRLLILSYIIWVVIITRHVTRMRN